MFAVRDQENLVHGHQTAAASKPLNQSTRQLPPKTPGNKVPKTPLKIPLNDENENNDLGAGKATLKAKGGLKNAFVTPIGTKARAPLGAKTTNAKTKSFQTPAPPLNDDLAKSKKNTISAQKPKPKPKPAETTKLEILGDKEDDVPDIEYMPPRSPDLPDIPEDHVERDLSMFQGNPFQGALTYLANEPGPDGLSRVQREERDQEKAFNLMQARIEARTRYDCDKIPAPCYHYPECPGEVCKDEVNAEKNAKEEFDRTMAMLEAEAAPKKDGKKLGKPAPSTIKSKEAAQALSKPKTDRRVPDPVKKPAPSAARSTAMKPTTASTTKATTTQPRAPLSKKAAAPINPSPYRHAAAVAASKTTLGPSKGRAVSASLRKSQSTLTPNTLNLPIRNAPTLPIRTALTATKMTAGFVPFTERDSSVDADQYYQRYGTPPQGSMMWLECWRKGYVGQSEEDVKRKEEEERREREEQEERERSIMEAVRRDALEDFELVL